MQTHPELTHSVSDSGVDFVFLITHVLCRSTSRFVVSLFCLVTFHLPSAWYEAMIILAFFEGGRLHGPLSGCVNLGSEVGEAGQ